MQGCSRAVWIARCPALTIPDTYNQNPNTPVPAHFGTSELSPRPLYHLSHHRVTWLGTRPPARTQRAARLRADLYHITVDGIFYCLMVGLAEMYFAKFIVSMELGQVASGLITTVPLVLAALLALSAPAILRKFGSFSRCIGTLASAQAFMLLPMAGIALTWPFVKSFVATHHLSWLAAGIVFATVTLYYFGAIATAAPWITVTGALVPARLRARYNARRLRILQVATLFALIFHGLAADGFVRLFNAFPALSKMGFDAHLTGFAAMFAIASFCRVVSAWHLFRYSTPKEDPSAQSHVHASDFLARFKQSNDGRFLVYAIAGNAALQIAQPFFNPWMLRQGALHGDLLDWTVSHLGPQAPYSILLAAVYIGRILMLDLSGTIAHKHGAVRLLWIGGLALPFMAIFWLFSSNFALLIVGQIATGAALSAWELGVFLMNYESIKPNERTAMLTYFTLANESGKTGGSLVGGGILEGMGKETGAYAAVFWTSFLARAAVLALLARLRATQPHERH